MIFLTFDIKFKQIKLMHICTDVEYIQITPWPLVKAVHIKFSAGVSDKGLGCLVTMAPIHVCRGQVRTSWGSGDELTIQPHDKLHISHTPGITWPDVNPVAFNATIQC